MSILAIIFVQHTVTLTHSTNNFFCLAAILDCVMAMGGENYKIQKSAFVNIFKQ